MSDWFLEALQACNELSQTWMESGMNTDLQISSLVRDKIVGLVYGRKLKLLWIDSTFVDILE